MLAAMTANQVPGGIARSRAAPVAGQISLRSRPGRWVLVATVFGSGLVFLDASVVNVALPTIAREFNTGLASLQWTVNAYTLTLAGLLLLGGSLGDHFGRRRIFIVGIIWFAAPTPWSALTAISDGVLPALGPR